MIFGGGGVSIKKLTDNQPWPNQPTNQTYRHYGD